LLFLQVRHKFEQTFLKVSAKNKQLFFFLKSPYRSNLNTTSALTKVKEPIGALGSFFDFLLMTPVVTNSLSPFSRQHLYGGSEETV